MRPTADKAAVGGTDVALTTCAAVAPRGAGSVALMACVAALVELVSLWGAASAIVAAAITANTDGESHISPSACLLYTSPSPRDGLLSRMPSSA